MWISVILLKLLLAVCILYIAGRYVIIPLLFGSPPKGPRQEKLEAKIDKASDDLYMTETRREIARLQARIKAIQKQKEGS